MIEHCARVSKFESKSLTTRSNSDRNFISIGGRHNKNDMFRRFFKGFKKCIKGGLRKHVNFVDNIDFVFTLAWRNNGLFAQIADIIDTSVAGGIDFDDVEIIIFELVFKTVNLVRQNTRYGRFASATWTNKKIGVRNFTVLQRALQNVGDLFLPNYLT